MTGGERCLRDCRLDSFYYLHCSSFMSCSQHSRRKQSIYRMACVGQLTLENKQSPAPAERNPVPRGKTLRSAGARVPKIRAVPINIRLPRSPHAFCSRLCGEFTWKDTRHRDTEKANTFFLPDSRGALSRVLQCPGTFPTDSRGARGRRD